MTAKNTHRLWSLTRNLTLLCDVAEVVREAAEQAAMALISQVIKADALLLAVEVHDSCQVMAEFALVPPRA